eukprot:1711311-Ditylum_brightwellii.AAC.1
MGLKPPNAYLTMTAMMQPAMDAPMMIMTMAQPQILQPQMQNNNMVAPMVSAPAAAYEINTMPAPASA